IARRGLSISGLSLESKYEAIMRFLRRGYRYFALHDTIVGIRPRTAGRGAGENPQRRHCRRSGRPGGQWSGAAWRTDSRSYRRSKCPLVELARQPAQGPGSGRAAVGVETERGFFAHKRVDSSPLLTL